MLLHSGAGFHKHEYSRENSTRNTEPRRLQLTRSAFPTPLPRRSTTTSRETPTPLIHVPGRSLSTSKIHHVRFQDPPETPKATPIIEVDIASDSGRSVASRTATDEGANFIEQPAKTRRRQSYRTKQKYVLSIPAPTRSQKLIHLHPRNVMQLRMVSNRVIPEFDVQELPRTFRSRGQLSM